MSNGFDQPMSAANASSPAQPATSGLLRDAAPAIDWPAISLDAAEKHSVRLRGGDVQVGEIPVEISAILGRTKIPVAKLMASNEGEQLRLDTQFGQPVELQVNGVVIGHGEIVADGFDNYIGIRLLSLNAAKD
ncbi:MAG: FliM/FliN family flagellar motor switch protein [Rhizobium sp.]|nr:FliM/FliN family flagellar motor switch protein [Rhizobium sp.]